MKKTRILIVSILSMFVAISAIQPSYSIDSISDKFKKTSRFLTVKDTVVKEESEIIIDRINKDCCNEKFEKKSELIKIKSFLEQCLLDKCYVKNIMKSGKPRKLVAIENIDLNLEARESKVSPLEFDLARVPPTSYFFCSFWLNKIAFFVGQICKIQKPQNP